MRRIKSRRNKWVDEREKTEHGVLEHVPKVVSMILSKTRTQRLTLKLRTILLYSYIAYKIRELDINLLRGLMARIRPPGYLTNQYFYEDIRRKLREEFGDNVEFVRRRQKWYAVFWNKEEQEKGESW